MRVALLLIRLADQLPCGDRSIDGQPRKAPHLGAILRKSLDQQTVVLLIGGQHGHIALADDSVVRLVGTVGVPVKDPHYSSLYPLNVIFGCAP